MIFTASARALTSQNRLARCFTSHDLLCHELRFLFKNFRIPIPELNFKFQISDLRLQNCVSPS